MGAWAWFRGIPTYDGKVMDFQSFYEFKNSKITFIFVLSVATWRNSR